MQEKTEDRLVPKLRFKEFKDDWKCKQIGDISRIYGRIGYRGYTIKDIVSEGEGAVTLSPSNFINNRINIDKATYISWFKYEESPEIKIKNGDILIIKTGSTYGKTAFVTNLEKKATINPQIIVLKDIKTNNVFLNYIVLNRGIKKQIEEIVVGGAIPTMSQKELSSMVFNLPFLNEQKKIAKFLTAVDEKLQQLTKKKEFLEEYKKGVMQKIFSQELRFKDDNGNNYPDWEEKKLGDIGVFISGTGFPNAEQGGSEGVPFLKVSDMNLKGNENKIKQRYDRLLKDEDFDKLDLGLKNPNIFNILKITNSEIRHSNFLSWLLDPNQSHKLGDIFLKRFLREVFFSEKFDDIDQSDVEGIDLTKVEIIREWKRIDLLIIVNDIVVCVENKVLSKEHSNQLKRYKEIINKEFPNFKKTFVYLNPYGESSEEESEYYHPISYEFIVESLEKILSVYGESINEKVKNYIKDYITTIKRELMGTDKLTELSKKIYKNHKELFDFIIEHKPDTLDRINNIFKNLILEKGWILGSISKSYIRFCTKPMKELIYINKVSNGWKKKESFQFELEIYPKSNKLIFRTVIPPSDEKYDSKKLETILREIDGFKPSRGKIWFINYSKSQKILFDEIDYLSDKEIENIANKFLEKINSTVHKVEEKFLSYKEELIKMKSF